MRLALGEKRLAFTETIVRYWERPAPFALLSPSGLTPVLVEEEDGRRLVVREVRAILEHLEEQHPEPALLGREPGERAEARRSMQWFDRKFDNEVNAYVLHEKLEKRLLKMGSPDLANIRHGRDALRDHLTYVESLLQDRNWLAGARLSPRRLRRGGQSLGAGLFRRCALARDSRRQDLVHEGQVQALLPADPRRPLAGHAAGRPL